MIKLYAPKGYNIRKIEVRGNVPRGNTTYLLSLRKGKLIIPFRKKIVRKGINTILKQSGVDSKGEYVVYGKRRMR